MLRYYSASLKSSRNFVQASWSVERVSEQFLNGTSAPVRHFSAMLVGRNWAWGPAVCLCVCTERDGNVCSPECSSAGCWGPRDTQCLSCAYFSLEDERCLSSCDSLPNIYQANTTTCSRCHPECDGCTNAVCLRYEAAFKQDFFSA